ncbi:S1/P1 nuclease [Planctomycetaceae bacterium]|nr:S1/P1 nuclease [Planctomycetaceae bacterium]
MTQPNRGRRLLAAGLVLLLVSGWPAPARSWWDSGHRLVALIAWDRMDVTTRMRVLRLLGKHPQAEKYFTPDKQVQGVQMRHRWIVSQAAVWSDLVRKTDRDRPTWHYINRPLFLSADDRRVLGRKLKVNLDSGVPKTATLATQELNVIQAITLCRRRLSARDASDGERALCVTWLCHMVGDVHQPCHSTASFTARRFPRGDRGGNDVPIRGDKKDINLHMYWDGQFGSGRTLNGDLVRRAASLLADAKLVSAGRLAEKRLKPGDWVTESHQLARNVVYSPVILRAIRRGESDPQQAIPAVVLSDDYARQAAAVSRRRVVEAGFRLARVLAEGAR